SALEPKSVTLKNSWLFRPAIHYYVVTRRLWWLDRDPDRIKRDGQADYYFLPEEDAAVLEREPFEVIRKFKVSGAVLARPRNRRVRPAAGGQAPFGADLSYDAYQNKMTDDFLKTTGINDGAAAFVGRAHYFEAQEKWEAAVGDYNRALRARPSDQEAYVALLGRAEAYARTDQLEKALADLTRAIRLLPDVGAGYWLRSGVFEKMGDAARAAEDRQKAYALGVRPRPAEPGMSLSGPANDGKIEQTEKAAD
ncbi:MAG: tetratricopeptide repeat protein, partial [Deltaproteobacteria bacterium]